MAKKLFDGEIKLRLQLLRKITMLHAHVAEYEIKWAILNGVNTIYREIHHTGLKATPSLLAIMIASAFSFGSILRLITV